MNRLTTKFNDILKEMMGSMAPQRFQVAKYSKAKTKEKFIEIVERNPKNPPIDLTSAAIGWTYGTPEEMRKELGVETITVVGNFMEDYYIELVYNRGKWEIIDAE